MSPFVGWKDGKLTLEEPQDDVEIWVCPRPEDIQAMGGTVDLMKSALGRCSSCGTNIWYEKARRFKAPKMCMPCAASKLPGSQSRGS